MRHCSFWMELRQLFGEIMIGWGLRMMSGKHPDKIIWLTAIALALEKTIGPQVNNDEKNL